MDGCIPMSSEKLERFIREIRSAPQFVAWVKQRPDGEAQMQAVETGLRFVDQRADDDPEMLASFDEICRLIDRQDLSIKQRLLAVKEVFVRLREAGRVLN
jgi:hypothetical protein